MNSQFHEKIAQLQTDYYKNNNKNMFFKSSQKLECAATITEAMDIHTLFEHSIYILPNTNKIYFDYPFFKTFATPAIFESLVTYMYGLINQTMQVYKQYEIHVNWQSYSVSAHDRYKDLYRIFLARYENSGFNFHDNLSRLCVYFTPTVIHLISKIMIPLIHPIVLSKITLHNKTESEHLIRALLEKTN
jgi:hypothetical protein